MALLARIALAAVAATATPTSLREALMLNLGAARGADLAAALVAVVVVPLVAFRPVKDGMVTAVEVTVAIEVEKGLYLCFVC